MQLSAELGHPDQPHFPHPPPQHAPPPSGKKKSPSQLRHQERRKQEAQSKADEAASKVDNISENIVNIVPANVSTGQETETVEAEIQEPAVKPVDKSAEQLNPVYKCNQCNYKHTTEKGLGMHVRMKHRISQIDGNNDSDEDTSEETEKVTSELDDLDQNEDKGTEKVKAEETFSFTIGEDGYPEVTVIDPGVKPPDRVTHPELGTGDDPVKIEDGKKTWWEYSFFWRGRGYYQRKIFLVQLNC